MFQSLLLPETAAEPVLESFIALAEQDILNYTNRTELPENLEMLSVQMAVVKYNRRGTEGESNRTEGVMSRTFVDDYPKEIKDQLNAARKVRAYRETDKS